MWLALLLAIGGTDRIGPPGPGIEAGRANGLAGGRTDEGPLGGTGIPGGFGEQHEHARAVANSQGRKPNAPGSFLRPPDMPPVTELHPRARGSGAPSLPPDEEPQASGKDYF